MTPPLIKRKRRKLIHVRKGMETMQIVMLVAVICAIMVTSTFIVDMWKGRSLEKWNAATVLAGITALFGVISWTVNRLVQVSPQRAQMLVREVLSDGKPRTFEKLLEDARAKRLGRRSGILAGIFPGSLTDAIAELVAAGDIAIVDKKYTLAKKSADSR